MMKNITLSFNENDIINYLESVHYKFVYVIFEKPREPITCERDLYDAAWAYDEGHSFFIDTRRNDIPIYTQEKLYAYYDQYDDVDFNKFCDILQSACLVGIEKPNDIDLNKKYPTIIICQKNTPEIEGRKILDIESVLVNPEKEFERLIKCKLLKFLSNI